MTAANDQTGLPPAGHDGPMEAQFGPHRFYAGQGGGSEEFRRARFEAADLRGAWFTDCDLTGVTIRDGWLVDVSISGYLSNVTINGVDVTVPPVRAAAALVPRGRRGRAGHRPGR